MNTTAENNGGFTAMPETPVPQGTYPSPKDPPAADAPKQAPPRVKTRRVGTLTMALCLIAVGVVLLVRVFVPSFDFLFVLRLSPVALIMLGLEFLYANFKYKEEKLRYDFLSVVISLLLMGSAITAAIVPEVIMWERERYEVSSRLSAELEQATQSALEAQGIVCSDVEWMVYSYNGYFDSATTVAELSDRHAVSLNLQLGEKAANKEQFAKECYRAAQEVLKVMPYVDGISFYSRQDNTPGKNGETRYTLYVGNPRGAGQTEKEYLDQVMAEKWQDDYGHYLSENEQVVAGYAESEHEE